MEKQNTYVGKYLVEKPFTLFDLRNIINESMSNEVFYGGVNLSISGDNSDHESPAADNIEILYDFNEGDYFTIELAHPLSKYDYVFNRNFSCCDIHTGSISMDKHRLEMIIENILKYTSKEI